MCGVALVCAILFPRPLLLFVASSYCKARFGMTLQIDEMHWERGLCRLTEGKLMRRGSCIASFDAATIRPRCSLLKRRYGGTIDVVALQCEALSCLRGSAQEIHVRVEKAKGELSCEVRVVQGALGHLTAPVVPDIEAELMIDRNRVVSASLSGTLFGLDSVYQWNELTHISFAGPLTQLVASFPQYAHLAMESIHGGAQLVHGQWEGALTVADHVQVAFGIDCLCEKAFSWLHQLGIGRHPTMWFDVSDCPVESMLSPFFFGERPLQLCGTADIHGLWIDQVLHMDYEVQDLAFQSTNVSLEARNHCSVGKHLFDWSTKRHVGCLPLERVRYRQHNYDLEFEDTSAILHMCNGACLFEDVKMMWEGLPIQGRVEVDVTSLDDVDIRVHAGCPQGDVETGQRFLSHFIETPLSTLPVHGTLAIAPQEAAFTFRLAPSLEVVSGHVQGHLSFTSTLALVQCEQGEVDFEYDNSSKTVTLRQLQASLSLGTLQHQLYAVQGTFAPQQWHVDALVTSPTHMPLPVVFHLEGKEVDITGRSFAVHAEQCEGGWQFDRIQWRDYCGAAQITTTPESCRLDHLTVAHPQIGRLVLAGEWREQVACGHLEIEALDLTKLLPANTQSWGFIGTLSGEGDVEWTPTQGLTLDMQGEYRNLEFSSLLFGDGEHLRVHYTRQEGVRIAGLEALGHYRLGELHYDPTIQRAYFDGFEFKIQPEMLPKVVDVAATLFPHHVNAATLDVLQQLKQEESLCGRLWIDLTPEVLWVHLQLKDGVYYLNHQPWTFKDFSLIYDPQEMYIKTKVRLGDVESSLHVRADSQSLSSGTLALQQEQEEDLLTMGWHKDPLEGYVVDEVRGTFAGIHCDLSRARSYANALALEGNITCLPTKTQALLPSAIREWMQRSAIGGEYRLKGDFIFPKSDLFHPSFVGEITAQDVACATILLSSLSCRCEAYPDHLALTNIAVCDWAGNLFCDQLHVRKEEQWVLNIDHVAIHDFRLSRLESSWTKRERGSRPLSRSFFINTFELNHLHGALADPNTFVGQGELNFTNMPRRTLFSNLMAIPLEITARIGLDLTALIPVRGTVLYDISEGRIHLRTFNDMYSDAKRSSFYLAENLPSYIGLDGSLNLCVKMKQYNLLMKLAELFTVTVKGSIHAPEYQLTMQGNSDN